MDCGLGAEGGWCGAVGQLGRRLYEAFWWCLQEMFPCELREQSGACGRWPVPTS